MDYKKLIKMRNEKSNFARYLGIKIVEVSEGYAKGEIEVFDELKNFINSIHGGCLFSLADTVAGTAASSRGRYVTTLSSSINYLAPAIDTKKLVAIAKEVKYGKTISVYNVDIFDEKNKLLVNGTFTFFYLGKEILLD